MFNIFVFVNYSGKIVRKCKGKVVCYKNVDYLEYLLNTLPEVLRKILT